MENEAFVKAFQRSFGSKGGNYDIDALQYLATSIQCANYASEHMKGKPRFASRHEMMPFTVGEMKVDGLVMEFGVATGTTINQIATLIPHKKVYGFDSFLGLPEDWAGLKEGHFARDSLPSVHHNVELIVGWFENSLPRFLESNVEKVSFLHVDCDLYSSTQTIFNHLAPRIVPGTIIVFDEYFNYPGWLFEEYLAFQNFVSARRVKYEYISLVPAFEHVAVKILSV